MQIDKQKLTEKYTEKSGARDRWHLLAEDVHNLTGLPYWKITAMMTGGKKPSQNHWWIGKEAVKRIYETVKAEADNPPALFNHLYKKEKENIQWRSFKPPHN